MCYETFQVPFSFITIEWEHFKKAHRLSLIYEHCEILLPQLDSEIKP